MRGGGTWGGRVPVAGLRRGGLALIVTCLLALASACSDDPSGPGTFDVVVKASVPIGAAVVELTGAPVDGVDEPARGWASLSQVGPDRYRLMIIAETPGELVASIRVPDVSGPVPTASVVDVTDQVDSRLVIGGPATVQVRR